MTGLFHTLHVVALSRVLSVILRRFLRGIAVIPKADECARGLCALCQPSQTSIAFHCIERRGRNRIGLEVAFTISAVGEWMRDDGTGLWCDVLRRRYIMVPAKFMSRLCVHLGLELPASLCFFFYHHFETKGRQAVVLVHGELGSTIVSVMTLSLHMWLLSSHTTIDMIFSTCH